MQDCFYQLCFNVWKQIQNLCLPKLDITIIKSLHYIYEWNVYFQFYPCCWCSRVDNQANYVEGASLGRFRQNASHRLSLFKIELSKTFRKFYERTKWIIHRSDNELLITISHYSKVGIESSPSYILPSSVLKGYIKRGECQLCVYLTALC